MKRTAIGKIITGILFILLVSCQNDDWSFPDFDYTTTYFPFQSPVRTLILGRNDQADISGDNLLQFTIGVRVAGMYENKKNWTVDYLVDNSLIKNLFNSSNDTMRLLPEKYYSLNPLGSVVVPAGSFIGNINVQLNNNFLEDTLAYKGVYVIPLKITRSTTDSILAGMLKSSVNRDTADIRKAVQWDKIPMNYTLYAVKFINKYHGTYLHRGADTIKTQTGEYKQHNFYHQEYVERDELWTLNTNGKSKILLSGTLRRKPSSPGSFVMQLSFDSNENCLISTGRGSKYTIQGAGKFISNGDKWGGKQRDAIHLKYQVTDLVNNEIHHVSDTLVIRDRGVVFETFTINVK